MGQSTAIVDAESDLSLHQESSFGVVSRPAQLPGILPQAEPYRRSLSRSVRDWLEEVRDRNEDSHCYAVDSCPIMLARHSNSTGAKVGKPLCNKCYNATRKEWYHGVKLHAFVMLRPGKLPVPCAFQISPASLCGLWAARQVDFDCAPVTHGKLFADWAYADTAWAETLRSGRAIELIAPRKKKPSDTLLSSDCLNSSVASCRQPIESFFNWLQIKSLSQNKSICGKMLWGDKDERKEELSGMDNLG